MNQIGPFVDSRQNRPTALDKINVLFWCFFLIASRSGIKYNGGGPSRFRPLSSGLGHNTLLTFQKTQESHSAMRYVFGWYICSWLGCLLLSSISLGDQPNKMPLRVLYLARDDDRRRETAFAEFLAANFVQSASEKRSTFKPETATQYDVILVDWSQAETHQPNADFGAPRNYPSPLGEREAWSTPTVFLGSAGQIIAGPWETIGGAG